MPCRAGSGKSMPGCAIHCSCPCITGGAHTDWLSEHALGYGESSRQNWVPLLRRDAAVLMDVAERRRAWCGRVVRLYLPMSISFISETVSHIAIGVTTTKHTLSRIPPATVLALDLLERPTFASSASNIATAGSAEAALTLHLLPVTSRHLCHHHRLRH